MRRDAGPWSTTISGETVPIRERILRYVNDEFPLSGDRIRNSRGGLGTVIRTTGKRSEPERIVVKWDEGIVEIEYDSASDFALVSRQASAR